MLYLVFDSYLLWCLAPGCFVMCMLVNHAEQNLMPGLSSVTDALHGSLFLKEISKQIFGIKDILYTVLKFS